LCNKVPTEATFSPALDKFAAGRLAVRVHDALITEHLVSEQLPLPAGDQRNENVTTLNGQIDAPCCSSETGITEARTETNGAEKRNSDFARLLKGNPFRLRAPTDRRCWTSPLVSNASDKQSEVMKKTRRRRPILLRKTWVAAIGAALERSPYFTRL
jgi:hypothetical protein